MAHDRITGRAPGAMPLLGHALPLLRDPLRFLSTLPGYGDAVWVRLGPFRAVVVCDPELTSQVLLDDRTFDKGGLLVERGREVVGNGVGTCQHEEHRRQRRLTQPAFHPDRFAGYARMMTDRIGSVTGAWRPGQEIDVLAGMQAITVRTTTEALVSAAVLSDDTLTRVADDFGTILKGIYRRMFLPAPLDRLPTPGNRRYDRARARLRGTLGRVIATYRASAADTGDVLSMLVGSGGAADGLSDTEITDQIITLFLAGTESTASALAWALHELGRGPDLERRLHAEVDTVLAGADPTLDDVPALELTGNIVNESLRMYPPGWLFTRVARVNTELGGLQIPSGTTVAYSPYLMHHRADLFPDPETFDPDRWTHRQPTPPARAAFVPFGAGPRKCLGDTFALTEATLALAMIAARWRLLPVPGTTVHRAVDTALRPRGLRMRVEPRHVTSVKGISNSTGSESLRSV